MAITHHDLTVTAPDLLGAAYDPTLAAVVFFVDTNLAADEAVIDTIAGEIRLGPARLTADAAGTAVFTNLIGTDSDNADLNLAVDAVLQYRVRAEYVNAVTRKRGQKWTSGWFELNDDANLATDITFTDYAPISWQTAFIERAEAYLTQQEEIAGLTGEDEAVTLLADDEDSDLGATLRATYVQPAGKTATGAASPQMFLNPKDYGAKFDMRSLATGEMTAASNVLHDPTYTFSAADVGKLIKVEGAGVAGAALKTTITGVSSGDALLGVAAATTVNGNPGQAPYTAGSVVFGTDDTDAIQACLDASVTYSTSAAANDRASTRWVWLPQGCALFTQLVIPRRAMVRGTGWGNIGTIYGCGFEQTCNTLLYQLWDVDDDAIIFTESSTGVNYVISDIADFSVQQDLDNTAGSCIAYRNAAGTALQWSDGNRAANIQALGAAEHGWYLPGGMVPGHMVNCRAMVCGGAGLYMNMAPNGSISDLDNFSADGCGDGAIYIKGGAGTATLGVVNIRSLKYECISNFYRIGAGRGEYAITFEAMGGARVNVDGVDVVAPPSEATAPTGAMCNTIDAQTPVLTAKGIFVRVLTDRGVAYGSIAQTGTPVQYRDLSYNDIIGADRPVALGVIDVTWTTGGSFRGTKIFQATGGNLRRVIGHNEWYGAAGENPGHQLYGAYPVYSLVNELAGADRHQAIIALETDGRFVIRSVKDDGSSRNMMSMRPGATLADDRMAFDVQLRLADRTQMIGSRMTIGEYYPPPFVSAIGTGALTLNTVYYIPFPIARDCTLDRIGLRVVGAAGAGGVVRLGLYTDDGSGKPSALVVDAGTASTTSAATDRELTISQAVTRGLYHVAVCAQVDAAATFLYGNRSHPLVGTTVLANATQCSARTNVQTGVSGALPSTVTLSDPGSAGGNRDVIATLRASA